MTAFGSQPLSGIMIMMVIAIVTDGDEESNVCYFSLQVTKECYS